MLVEERARIDPKAVPVIIAAVRDPTITEVIRIYENGALTSYCGRYSTHNNLY